MTVAGSSLQMNLSLSGVRLSVDWYPQFLSSEESQALFDYLEASVPWTKDITPGRRVNQNYGDPGVSYKLTFGDKVIVREVLPWDQCSVLKVVKDRLESLTEARYNYCALLRYPNGKVGIAPHRDKEIKSGTCIAGISLGATRKFKLLPPYYAQCAPIELTLPPGSLYVLRPPTNDCWAHCIEPDPTVKEPRISLTYRLN